MNNFSNARFASTFGNANVQAAAKKKAASTSSGSASKPAPQMRSAFGGATAPGSNTMNRPAMSQVKQPRQFQQQQQQRAKPQMSLSQMSSFIRSQPGGRSFIDESDRSGPVSFDQTLSHAGAKMAQKGQLPPELAAMAQPFKSNKQTQQTRQGAQQYWSAQSAAAKKQQQQRAGWQNSPQAQTIEAVRQYESAEARNRQEKQAELRQMEEIARMGVPFKRSGASVNIATARQETQKVNRESIQQRQQQEQRLAPPAVHIVRQQHPVAQRSKTFSAASAAPFETVLESLVSENQKPRGGHAFNNDEKSPEQLQQEAQERRLAEQPSSLFSDTVNEIMAAVQHSNQDSSATFQPLITSKPKSKNQPTMEPV